MNIKSVNTVLTHETICEVCGNNFTPKTKKVTIYCSIKCRQAGSNEKIRLQNQEKFLLEHGDDPHLPVCKECGWKAFDLVTHITKFHKMPMKEYYSKHNCGVESVFHPEQLKNRQDRIAGEKNPGYQHGGKLSSVSKNFIHYQGLSSEETTTKINNIVVKQAESRENNNGYTTRVSYWLARGFNLDESIQKVKERQSTFSLQRCIEELGEIEGTKRWNDRQQLWMYNLYSKMTQAEIDDLNHRKTFAIRNGWSKIALSLFDELTHPFAVYATHTSPEEYMIESKDGTRVVSVDYILGNHVIEFYGDAYHANPKLYNALDIPTPLRNQTAQETWNKDVVKQDIIKEAGYQLLIVWEHDYKWNKDETIQRCRDFLGLK